MYDYFHDTLGGTNGSKEQLLRREVMSHETAFLSSSSIESGKRVHTQASSVTLTLGANGNTLYLLRDYDANANVTWYAYDAETSAEYPFGKIIAKCDKQNLSLGEESFVIGSADFVNPLAETSTQHVQLYFDNRLGVIIENLGSSEIAIYASGYSTPEIIKL